MALRKTKGATSRRAKKKPKIGKKAPKTVKSVRMKTRAMAEKLSQNSQNSNSTQAELQTSDRRSHASDSPWARQNLKTLAKKSSVATRSKSDNEPGAMKTAKTEKQ